MSLPNFHVHSWQSAEENAARWMRSWGFADARITSAGPDGGIDVTSATADAQVKFQASAVGRPAVQHLAGASRPGRTLIFFTGSLYSAQAIEFAETRRIALFTYDLAGNVTAANATARLVMRQANVPQANAPTPTPIGPDGKHLVPGQEPEPAYWLNGGSIAKVMLIMIPLGLFVLSENEVLGWVLMAPGLIALGLILLFS